MGNQTIPQPSYFWPFKIQTYQDIGFPVYSWWISHQSIWMLTDASIKFSWMFHLLFKNHLIIPVCYNTIFVVCIKKQKLLFRKRENEKLCSRNTYTYVKKQNLKNKHNFVSNQTELNWEENRPSSGKTDVLTELLFFSFKIFVPKNFLLTHADVMSGDWWLAEIFPSRSAEPECGRLSDRDSRLKQKTNMVTVYTRV